MTDKEIEVYSEKAETKPAEMSEEEIRAAALAYARYLKEHNLAPGDATFVEDEELEAMPEEEQLREVPAEDQAEEENQEKKEAEDKEKPEEKKAGSANKKKRKKKKDKKKKETEGRGRKEKSGKTPLFAAIVEFHDRRQDRIDDLFINAGKSFAKGAHTMASTYNNTRRSIGVALLLIGILAAVVLMIFDQFTVYEYAYNGKILGYVNEQEEVTDVLGVAGKELTKNSSGDTGVEFVANQNVTFNLVDGRGKSTDDADTAVNKLIYLTDIETEAFGIYDGDKMVAVVKDDKEAEELLSQAKAELSKPDNGMELISSEYINELHVRPVNVLLSSVQSHDKALKQMVRGGDMETFHIAEEGETIESIAEEFGVDVINVYDGKNKEIAAELEQGDKVCIRSTVEPVNVEMVEEGRMKETIEYKTIKKESDEYYEGDTYVKQKGVNGIQVFEGSLTKVAGEVTERNEVSTETIRKVQNKIILVGTKERPKTAPTGTFAVPLQTYVVTSEYGGRWGRMHDGIDLGASTGTPIYASDGGTIIRASYYGGYGNCVEIDHENGKVTRYAHCSRILVSTGDKVYQGQNIALVGNTGHSFGSHLHFEVRINGASQNPRNYVKF